MDIDENNPIQSERLILKKDKSQVIQALVSNRAIMRKKLILDYLHKHRICTKYEINKEIRTYEQEQALKGCIDAKTTKRMIVALEQERKLDVFYVNLKNVGYMCVKTCDVSETSELYVNYCSTFKRTFDSVDLNGRTNQENEPNSDSGAVKSKSDKKQAQSSANSSIFNSSKDDQDQSSFKLTRSFIASIVEKLKFSHNYCKMYALAPKFQKAIILHRFLTHLLFFFDQKNEGWLNFLDLSSHSLVS
jgi:hypothetical protein